MTAVPLGGKGEGWTSRAHNSLIGAPRSLSSPRHTEPQASLSRASQVTAITSPEKDSQGFPWKVPHQADRTLRQGSRVRLLVCGPTDGTKPHLGWPLFPALSGRNPTATRKLSPRRGVRQLGPEPSRWWTNGSLHTC